VEKNEMSEKCNQLHLWFNGLKRHTFCNGYADQIPQNGIYIIFEKGEKAHYADRIVRIGTHNIGSRGNSTLEDRLEQHISPNGLSVFRNKIGDALINKSRGEGSSFWSEEDLIDWNKSWGKGVPRRHIRFQQRSRSIQFEEADRLISEYIRENISFVCIEIDKKDDRKLIEKRLISTVSNCTECQQSVHWLGNYSTKEKVRKSGLWQENELWKSDFSDAEFGRFEGIVRVLKVKYG
jgi:hypothetical protein